MNLKLETGENVEVLAIDFVHGQIDYRRTDKNAAYSGACVAYQDIKDSDFGETSKLFMKNAVKNDIATGKNENSEKGKENVSIERNV